MKSGVSLPEVAMTEPGTILVEVVEAWPRRYESRSLRLPVGSTVAEAIEASGLGRQDVPAAIAVFGERVSPAHVLVEGDRVELLRDLVIDPKESRRRRAEARKARQGRG